MKNLELLKERLERQLKKINFELKNVKTEEHKYYLQGKKDALEMALNELKWEETKILNNW